MAQAPTVYAAADLRRRLDALPRFHLTELPTPLLELPNLTRKLGGPRLLMKRDDLTQHGLGGNKNRKFQFEVGAALAQGCDVLLWGGGVMQSNHARQCAAAARRAGLDVVLVLNEGPHGDELQGNRLLLDILGTDVRPTGRDGMFGHEADLAATAEDLRAAGRKPYVIDYGPLTSIGYVECVLEIHEQSQALGTDVTHLYVASGGGTQAGLELGNRSLGAGYAIRGFSPLIVDGGRTAQQAAMANATAELLGLDVRVRAEDIWNSQAFVGPAYAEATPEGLDAIRLVAETEGIFLEPVYTGKAFAALLDDVRRRDLTERDTVVFLHTGGTPLIFAYAHELGESSQPNG